MSEDFSREIRKLKVRVEDYLKEEEKFVSKLKNCLGKFTELNNRLERSKMSSADMENLMRLRLETVQAFSEALKSQSMAEHERSHLLESYGALVLSLEKEFRALEA